MKIYPHQQLEEDFRAVLTGAQRQEEFGNIGELRIAKDISEYFQKEIMIFYKKNFGFSKEVNKFVENNIKNTIINLRLTSEEVSRCQKRLLDIKDEMIQFLKDHDNFGYKTINLKKLSDFQEFVEKVKNNSFHYKEAKELLEKGIDLENTYFPVIVRAIADIYAKALPYILKIIKKAKEIEKNPKNLKKYEKVVDISADLDWIENKIGRNHALYPVLGNMRDQYKLIRNNANHPGDLIFDKIKDEIVVLDETKSKRFDINEFSRTYRILTYFTDIFIIGILWAYCEKEKNTIAYEIFLEYNKQFPNNLGIEYIIY